MSFRTTTVLLFLAALCASVYVWVGLDTRPRAPEGPRHVFSSEWRAENVQRVTIERGTSAKGGEPALVAERENDGTWRIVTPVATPAEQGAIAEMLENVG